MSKIDVRQATLDDTQAISALFCAHIPAWQRLNAAGQVEDVGYEALTLYERWLHGGPWMSVETGAIQLSHLLRGAGLPLVALVDGVARAYTEAYHNHEPAPFGHHLSLVHPVVHPDYAHAGLEAALIEQVAQQARARKCQRLTVNLAVAEQRAFYESQGLRLAAAVRRYNLPARTGQGFYRAVEHPQDDPRQIENWFMVAGRLGGSRQQWELLWPRTWAALPEIARQQPTYHLEFTAAGQTALVCCQQQLYAPRHIDVYAWSPKPLTAQLLTSVRDWAHREGYRTLVLAVADDTLKTLGAEAEPDGFSQDTYGLDL
jgi:GNAT superfamily N-acetyltransferase